MSNSNFLSPHYVPNNPNLKLYSPTSQQNKNHHLQVPNGNSFEAQRISQEAKLEKIQQIKNKIFPKALASHSMINMNTVSSARRAPFGALESMARKVTPAFQEDDLNQVKMPKSQTQIHQESPNHNGNSSKQALFKKFSSNPPTQQYYNGQPLAQEQESPKKRRQSIDLSGLKKEKNGEILSMMRRAKNPEQAKVEVQQDPGNIDNIKAKTFQFLKKRREAAMNQISTTASMIGPSSVHSMKDLGQYSHQQPSYKRPQFLTTFHIKTDHQPKNTLTVPQEKHKVLSSSKVEDRDSLSRNLEFKKKKMFDSPIEPLSAKPLTLREEVVKPKEIITMKQKMAKKNQREIKLQDFDLLQKLGKGAFGDVYIAQEKNIGFICVIKKMSKKRIRETKVTQHILREIKIQSYLNHPNLTSLYGYFHDEQYLYLVLEALPDGSLQNVKKKKKLPEKQAAVIVKQVAEGLKYMHDEYIIHRDLKPQNLFVNENFIKLGDFGCSIYNSNLVLRNTVVGCLEYSSPEQLSKEGYSQKIDSWSLGILTYELLFGKSPFESDIIKLAKNKELKPELSTLNFPENSKIKMETRDFIQNLLEQRPENRMDMDQVLHHPFLSLAQQSNKNAMRIESM